MRTVKKKHRSFLSSFNLSKKTILLIIIALTSVISTSVISAILSDFQNLTVPSIGAIKVVGVELYWNSSLENKIETINWGVIQPGSSVNVTVYIKNVSNIKTTLDFVIAKCNPSGISDFIDLSWDYDGALLSSGELVQVNLLMTFSSDVSFIPYIISNDVTDFDLEIHFIASEFLKYS